MTENRTSASSGGSTSTLEHILLSVPYPIVQFEGMELRVTYANNAILELWCKDSSIIGQKFLDILPELAEQPFPVLLRNVIETGETRSDTEALAYMTRNGQREAFYFDYSYTPVKNSKGEVTGVIVICTDVTGQVHAKQRMKDAEEQLRTMIAQAPIAISVLKGHDLIIDTANARCLEILGKTSSILGKPLDEAMPELKEQGFIDPLKNSYASGEPFIGKGLPLALEKDGKPNIAFVNFIYQPIVERNEITSIMAVGYDVTEMVLSKKVTEKKKALLEYLNKAGEELALALDTRTAVKKVSDIVVPNFADWFTINILDGEDLKIFHVVNKNEEYIQWTKEHRLKNPVTVHDKGALGHVLRTGESILIPNISDEMLESAMENQEDMAVIKEMNLRSGIVVPMKIGTKVIGTLNFVSTVDGKKYDERDLSFAKDFATRIALALENSRLHEEAQLEIAERKNVEAALRQSEEKFRSLSNAIPQLAWMADKDGWVYWFNDRWFEYTGTTLEEMLGWGWEKVHHPEHKQKIVEYVQEAWQGSEPFELEFPLRRKDGEWGWFLTRVVPIFDGAGQLTRWLGTNTDITEQKEGLELRKKLLAEMEFERNQFEAVVTQMPGALVIGEAPSGRLIFANEKIDEVWGHPFKNSQNISEYIEWIGFHPDGRRYEADEWPLARSIRNGELVKDEDVDIIKANGEPAILRINSAPIRDSSGKIIAGVVISQDVTELKRAVRTRDEFLSIASHELKTPLTTLTASIQMLQRVYDHDSNAAPIRSLIDSSRKSAIKLRGLIHELLNVSKIESGQLKLTKSTFKVADVINECCQHIRLQGTHDLVLEGDLEAEVYADKQRIDQVIVNFVNNAVKYGPDSKIIRLLIETVGDQVKISVIDQGIGISEEKLPHLFERYYRVDPSGMQYSGLGLGLFISSEIIKLHNGKIGVTSKLNEGSTFWLMIPIKA